MPSVPELTNIHVPYGAISHGLWCEEHALPHRAEARVYGMTNGGATLDLGTVTLCDEDDS